MKIIVVLPIDTLEPAGEFLGHEAVTDMARHLEAVGFHGAAVTDHPAPSGRWLDAGGHHAQDPFSLLGFLAAVTSKIVLQTGILVLPYRNPFITTRACNTVDALSGGRLVLGVGAGYLKGEYKALGADFENRNDVMDEYLRAMKAAWGAKEFDFEGSGYSARGIRILPAPVQKPHPPLWIGGNSKRAIRRAVEFGDAWSPFQGSGPVIATARTVSVAKADELAEGIAYMNAHAEKIGRAKPPAIVMDSMQSPTPAFNAGAWLDALGALEKQGVSWASIHVPGRSRAEWRDNAERYAKDVIAKIA